jgi:TRAP-type C4-dicarboxylate transport system permease large subunit
MDEVFIIMICLPVFMPTSNAPGFDPFRFGVRFLVSIEMDSSLSPSACCSS